MKFRSFGAKNKSSSMRRVEIVTVIFLALSMGTFYGQSIIKNNDLLKAYKSIPKESVFIHYNSTTLFVGERMYYSVYCQNPASGNLSRLSKIAYVEMVGKDEQAVFRHKIKLENGLGQGDFFIPTTVSTGSYKLIGYTQWMKNDGQTHFFQSDVRILNPYQIIPKAYLEEKEVDSSKTDSIIEPKPVPVLTSAAKIQSGTNYVSLSSNRKKFKKRKKVSLKINSLTEYSTYGNYSISVRKIDDFKRPNIPLAHNYLSFNKKHGEETPLKLNETVFLPELRGELISGKVIAKDSGKPMAGVRIALSLPGKDFMFQVANSNKNGVFYFNLGERYENTVGIFQALDEDKEELDILIDKHNSPEYRSMEHDAFTVGEEMKEMILTRSIHNQIENAYASVKSDTIITKEEDIPFYRSYHEKYDLDDYTRFKTIGETMVEIIDHVWIKKSNRRDSVFQIRPFDLYLESNDLLPLVIMDGVCIQHHKEIIDFNAKRIKNVYISRSRYLVGSQVFQGIMAIETIQGNFHESFFKDYLYNVTLFKPLATKKYFFQEYLENNGQDHIPDYRYQLFWKPNMVLGPEEKTINFYTSDIVGDFEILLEGYTYNGKPVSLRETIRVE